MNKRKSILVIDDHDSIRFILSRFLGKEYLVTTKEDGLEALSWLGKGNIPDLVLLDMSMPKLSGFEFLANLKSSGFFSDIPVMVLTGFGDKRYEEQCKKLGAIDYIVKPFNPIDLKGKIGYYLGETN